MDDNLHVQIEADPMDSFIPHKISVVYYAKQPVDTVDLIARLRTNDSNPVLDQIYLQLPTEIPNLSPLDQDPTTFAVYLLFKWIKNSTTDFYRADTPEGITCRRGRRRRNCTLNSCRRC